MQSSLLSLMKILTPPWCYRIESAPYERLQPARRCCSYDTPYNGTKGHTCSNSSGMFQLRLSSGECSHRNNAERQEPHDEPKGDSQGGRAEGPQGHGESVFIQAKINTTHLLNSCMAPAVSRWAALRPRLHGKVSSRSAVGDDGLRCTFPAAY